MKNLKVTKIAKILDISHSAVSQWFNGKTKPNMDNAILLEEKCNIPLSAWKDIKSFISSENNTKKSIQKTSTTKKSEVS